MREIQVRLKHLFVTATITIIENTAPCKMLTISMIKKSTDDMNWHGLDHCKETPTEWLKRESVLELSGSDLELISVSIILHSIQAAYHPTGAGTDLNFCSIKRLGVLLLPLDGTPFHRRPPAPSPLSPTQLIVRSLLQPAPTHLYSWVEKSAVRVTYLSQEHNTKEGRGPCSSPASFSIYEQVGF